jgi:hypothetical protein
MDIAFKDNNTIMINGLELSVRDCIEFERLTDLRDESTKERVKAVVLGFGFDTRNGVDKPTRIFYLPWRPEGRWASPAWKTRFIGLGGIYTEDFEGQIAGIKKLDDCPGELVYSNKTNIFGGAKRKSKKKSKSKKTRKSKRIRR